MCYNRVFIINCELHTFLWEFFLNDGTEFCVQYNNSLLFIKDSTVIEGSVNYETKKRWMYIPI